MSRSIKQPYHSVTTCGTRAGIQKSWKKDCNRKFRRIPVEKDLPNGGKYKKLSGNPWDSPSDGRVYNPEWKKAHRK